MPDRAEPLPADAWTAVILSGGRGSRMGGVAKGALTIEGTTLLDRALQVLPPNIPVIVAGPAMDVAREVEFCREDPPFTGPVAAVAAAMAQVTTPIVVVLAVDSPNAASLASSLAARCDASQAEAVLTMDGESRSQPLCAAYRVDALRRELAAAKPEGRAMRDVVAGLSIEYVDGPEVSKYLDDIDTVEQLERARGQAKGRDMLKTWVNAVQAELGLDGVSVDIDKLLDVARDAAHRVERPAAPLTLYLMGLAVGAGQDSEQVATKIEALADGWAD